ncbi:MAG: homoserine kinase [Flavobacteriales bacterium]|nr:homoserine kinase [Flavobacteriales bacterium]
MKNEIHIQVPATVANVACGFDIMGFALERPGDRMSARLEKTPGIRIKNTSSQKKIPLDPSKNTAGVALQCMLDALGSNQGFTITIHEKIKPGSGLGSSAASSAGAVFAANELLGKPFSVKDLIPFAMEGERLASGTAHADNVSPALMGGFTLVRSYTPLDVIAIPYPPKLFCAVVHPQIEVRTEDTRKILRNDIRLRDAVTQWGNTAGLVAGLMLADYELIGRSLYDVVIEPTRSILIPGFDEVKAEAMKAGALGCSISGSGPSIFALAKDMQTANHLAEVMKNTYKRLKVPCEAYASRVNPNGPGIIK